jgi:hypothetical protein
MTAAGKSAATPIRTITITEADFALEEVNERGCAAQSKAFVAAADNIAATAQSP